MINQDIDEKALEYAADKLDEIGTHRGWWKLQNKSWRESDPIGREEFLSIVWEIVKAYKNHEQ